MARKYRNAGIAGADWSALEIEPYPNDSVALEVTSDRAIAGHNVVLDKEQVIDLIEQLSVLIGNTPRKAAKTQMIEGSDYAVEC